MAFFLLPILLFFPLLGFAGTEKNTATISKKLPSWAKEQLHEDFSYYTKHPGSFLSAQKIMDLDKKNMADRKLMRLIVKKQKVIYKINDKETKTHVDRIKAIKRYFNKLVEKNPQVECDIVISLHDSLDSESFPYGPIFVFAKRSDDALRVAFPDPEALSGNKQFLKLVDEAKHAYPWQEKIEKAVFRGAMTGRVEGSYQFNQENFLLFPRSMCVTKSLQHPELIDARFSAITQTQQPEIISTVFQSYFAPPLNVREQLKYKYQILIDGNTCAYSRFFWQLFSDGLIIKQDSPDIQWFYKGVRPNVHFLPCKWDMSNLPSQILYAKQNDAKALEIIKNANIFAQESLTKKAISSYVLACLEYYQKLAKR